MKVLYSLPIYFWLLLSGTAPAAAQFNLVPNPSFEKLRSVPCGWSVSPNEFSQLVEGWITPSSTSTDVFTTKADPGCWSNPLGHSQNKYSSDGNSYSQDERVGTQQPRSGHAMAGIYTYVESHVWHEYMQIELAEPLVPGKRYCVEMWVSLGDNCSYASNNLGMLFTAEAVRGGTEILANPQVNQETVVTDYEGWTIISGSFTPTEEMRYLTIGNFMTDQQTEIVPSPSGGSINASYYFIDDVQVVLCPPI